MELLEKKLEAVLTDIEIVNTRMRELENERAQRITQLHELRGAQNVLCALLEQAKGAERAFRDAAALDTPAGLEELSDYEREKLGHITDDEVDAVLEAIYDV